MFQLCEDVSAEQIERAASIWAFGTALSDPDRAKYVKRLLILSADWDTAPHSGRKLLTLQQFLRSEREIKVLKEASQTIQIAVHMLDQDCEN